MGLARRDVLAVKAAIEVDRGVDLLHDGAGTRGEPPAPHLVAHDPTARSPPDDRPTAQKRPAKRRLAVIALGGIAGVAVGLAAVYGIGAMQRNPAGCGLPARPPSWPSGSRRWRAAKSRRVEHRGRAEALPDLAFTRRRRQAAHARRLPRPHRAAEPVGHLVRAVPQGDAGARRAAGQARRRQFRGRGGQYRHAQSRQAEGLAEGGRRSSSSPISPIRAPRCSRISRRSARRSACRPPCWSIARAASSARSPAPPNGRATTRSS